MSQDIDEVEGGEPLDDQQETLIGGKFRTVDDLLSAYQESERAMHGSQGVSGTMRRQLEEWGCTVGDDGSIQLPPGVGTQPVPAAAPDAEDMSDQFYQDPVGFVSSFMAGQRQVEKAARANVKRAVAQLKREPLYSEVADDLDAELETIPDQHMQNPQAAQQIVQGVFERVAGKYALRQSARAKDDPNERSAMLRKLGVEPQQTAPEGGRVVVSAEDKQVLAAMNLRGKDAEEVIKLAKARVKEEE